jgi:CRP-like cAMP-binding protein
MSLSSISLNPHLTSPVPPAPQTFDARASLLRMDCLWQIEDGLVRTLTWLEDGTLVATGIWGKGDRIGKPLTKLDPYQIECISRVRAVPLPLTHVEDMDAIVWEHLQQAEALMQIRSYKRVDMMLLKLLTWLSTRFGQDVDTGRLIDLRLTHRDLSELLGATRVTVTRTLNQLEQQRLIERLPLQRLILREEEIWHYEI